MTSFAPSELNPFGYETERRGLRSGALPVPSAPNAPPKGDGVQLLRSLPNPRDKSLSTLTLAWRDRFPPAQRPNALCDSYPRVANRVALCWDDKVLAALLFKDLLRDKRGGRRGFPPAVQRDLLALHDAVRML